MNDQLRPLPSQRNDRRKEATRARAVIAAAAYHAHFDKLGHPRAPYLLRPLDLDELEEEIQNVPPVVGRHAVAWLFDAQDPGVQSRIAPTLVNLLGAQRYNEIASSLAPHTRTSLEIDGVGALRDAKVPSTSRFTQALDALTPNSAVRATAAEPAFAATRLPVTRCLELTVGYDQERQITRVSAGIEVDRPPGDFVRLADPRNWHDNSPLFFRTSALVMRSGAGFAPMTPAPRAETAYETVGDAGPYVYEDVTMSWTPAFPLEGRNVLSVRYCPFDPTKPQYGMSVQLLKCLRTSIGASSIRGGLDIDGGQFVVSSTEGGGSRLLATKVVRFTSRELCGIELGYWLNRFASLWLAPWLALMVYQGALGEAEGTCAPQALDGDRTR